MDIPHMKRQFWLPNRQWQAAVNHFPQGVSSYQ